MAPNLKMARNLFEKRVCGKKEPFEVCVSAYGFITGTIVTLEQILMSQAYGVLISVRECRAGLPFVREQHRAINDV